jgi:hypothetical protein
VITPAGTSPRALWHKRGSRGRHLLFAYGAHLAVAYDRRAMRGLRDCEYPLSGVRIADVQLVARYMHRYMRHTSVRDIPDAPDARKQRKSPQLRAPKWAILGSDIPANRMVWGTEVRTGVPPSEFVWHA